MGKMNKNRVKQMQARYEGPQMIKGSRFVRFYADLTDSEQRQAVARIDELVAENPEYADKGNYSHLCNLFSAIAIYEVFLKSGNGKDESLQKIAEAMWAFVENGTAKKYRKIFGLPGALWLLGKMLPKMFSKGSGYGWEYVWHNDTATDRHLQFECTSCIYAQLFAKYGVPELGPVFCKCDDINYGKIPGLTFKRKHALCNDGQPCDFLFVKEKNK